MATPHIKLVRLEHSHELQELLKRYHNAFILLTVIAQRARRTQRDNILNLDPGEALIGDHANYGLSEQNYRTAKKQLTKFKLATFRATTKGTVATLSSSNIYDINAEQGNDQDNTKVTDGQRTGNGRVTTKKNVRMKNALPPLYPPPGEAFSETGGRTKKRLSKTGRLKNFARRLTRPTMTTFFPPKRSKSFSTVGWSQTPLERQEGHWRKPGTLDGGCTPQSGLFFHGRGRKKTFARRRLSTSARQTQPAFYRRTSHEKQTKSYRKARERGIA